MALTAQEQKELTKLIVANVDKEGKPLKDAETKALARINELLARAEPEAPIRPEKIKNYKPSEVAKDLIAKGGEFQGVESRNHGTEEKPVLVLREWFYVGTGAERKACFVLNGKVIDAGRTIARSALDRFQK